MDGYTEEGYAYTLVGTEKTIKLLFRTKKIEVYHYDHLNQCDACGERFSRVYLQKRIPVYTGRGYCIFHGSVDGNIWHTPLQLCPGHFVTYQDMFVGLESNDP